MPKVRWLRWTAWAVLVGLLIALGVGIYHAQPHDPLWQTQSLTPDELSVSLRSLQFSRDGGRVITYAVRLEMAASLTMQVPERLEAGVVEVRDRSTGERLTSHP